MAFGNDYGIKKSIKKCIYVSLIFGTLAGLTFCICSNFIVKICFHNKVSKVIVYLIAVALPMISTSSSISGYFTAVRRVYKSVIANFLEYVAKIIITIFLLKKYIPLGNIEGICFALILGDVLSEVCSFAYNIFVFVFDINLHLGNSFKNRNEKALADYGTITGMAMPIVMFPATFLYATSGLLIPELSRYYVKKDYIKIKKYSHKLIIRSIFLCDFIKFNFPCIWK